MHSPVQNLKSKRQRMAALPGSHFDASGTDLIVDIPVFNFILPSPDNNMERFIELTVSFLPQSADHTVRTVTRKYFRFMDVSANSSEK